MTRIGLAGADHSLRPRGQDRAGDILTMYMGPYELLVNLGVVFAPGTTAEQMHEAIHRIEKDLAAAYPECTRVYIEAESVTGGR